VARGANVKSVMSLVGCRCCANVMGSGWVRERACVRCRSATLGRASERERDGFVAPAMQPLIYVVGRSVGRRASLARTVRPCAGWLMVRYWSIATSAAWPADRASSTSHRGHAVE